MRYQSVKVLVLMINNSMHMSTRTTTDLFRYVKVASHDRYLTRRQITVHLPSSRTVTHRYKFTEQVTFNAGEPLFSLLDIPFASPYWNCRVELVRKIQTDSRAPNSRQISLSMSLSHAATPSVANSLRFGFLGSLPTASRFATLLTRKHSRKRIRGCVTCIVSGGPSGNCI